MILDRRYYGSGEVGSWVFDTIKKETIVSEVPESLLVIADALRKGELIDDPILEIGSAILYLEGSYGVPGSWMEEQSEQGTEK